MDKFIRLPEVRVEGIKKHVYLTPVLAKVSDGYRIHYIDADGISFTKTRFVPIEHVGRKRRKTLDVELENAKLRELASELYQQVLQDDAAWRDVRAWEDGLPSDCLHPIRSYDDSLGKYAAAPKFEKRMRELGVLHAKE